MVMNMALATYSQRRSNSTGTTRMEFLVGTGGTYSHYVSHTDLLPKVSLPGISGGKSSGTVLNILDSNVQMFDKCQTTGWDQYTYS
jgi:hypothetical protein